MANLNDACLEVANALLRAGKDHHEVSFSVPGSNDNIVIIVRRGDKITKAPLRKGLGEQVRIMLGPSPSGVCECCGK